MIKNNNDKTFINYINTKMSIKIKCLLLICRANRCLKCCDSNKLKVACELW